MKPGAAFWKWTAIGGVVAGILMLTQAMAVGGPSGLLQVGHASALRPVIEEELGPVPLGPGPGHDGQIYYAIALDLDGDVVAELLHYGAYRYRRILYPLISSVGGTLDGRAVLYSMIGVTLASTAVAAGAVAAIASRGGRSDWVALVVLLNPGVWLSTRLLTADTPALALMVVALFFATTRSAPSIASFALSGLAKDVYLATPAGLAFSKIKRRWVTLLVPALILLLWMIWLQVTMGDAFTSRGNLGSLTVPFAGIVEGAANWPTFDTSEWLYLLFALGSIAIGLATAGLRSSWLRWSIVLWSVLGIISSSWIWDFGNNAARAFAPIVVLVALSYVPPNREDSSEPSLDNARAG